LFISGNFRDFNRFDYKTLKRQKRLLRIVKMKLEKANSTDNEVLTAITKKSKAYWGYSDEQIQNWSKLVTVTPTYIETKSVYKLVVDAVIVGYYSFFYEDDATIKLDNLFILPEYIGKGLGRILMDDFLILVKRTNVNKRILDSEPNAEKSLVFDCFNIDGFMGSNSLRN
jgi:GNAT superfamily N-acetyltransferase